MDENNASVKAATVRDILGLDTWNRERTSQELQDFITTRHNSLPDDVELF